MSNEQKIQSLMDDDSTPLAAKKIIKELMKEDICKAANILEVLSALFSERANEMMEDLHKRILKEKS